MVSGKSYEFQVVVQIIYFGNYDFCNIVFYLQTWALHKIRGRVALFIQSYTVFLFLYKM